MKPAYFVGLISIRDQVFWQAYVSQVGETIARYGGEVIFRGARVQTMSGDLPYKNIVTLKFPDLAAATSWHASPEYQRLIPIRDAGATVTLVLYE